MRWLALLLLPLLAVALLGVALLDRFPLVKRGETISPAAVAQAKRLLTSNDPRRLRNGEQRSAQLPAALIDEGINHLASRKLHGRGAFLLGEETAEIRLSVPLAPILPILPSLPGWLAARYVNFSLTFREAEGEPRIERARLGVLPIPSLLAEPLFAAAIELAGFGPEWLLARSSIRRLAFEPASASVGVDYVWDPGLIERAVARAFDPADLRRIELAQRALAAMLDHYAAGAHVPLTTLLPPLLRADGQDASAQGRAALFVLASYLGGRNLARLLPEAGRWPRPRQVKVMLLGRDDSAQHFGISAALAAWAGEPAADAIGLYKELDDAHSGSGFSFADLAADRAGARFGQLVVNDQPRLQRQLAGPLSETDLAPALGGLPEYLPEAEFKRRYGNRDGRDNAAYRELSDEIERRVAALPLYRR